MSSFMILCIRLLPFVLQGKTAFGTYSIIISAGRYSSSPVLSKLRDRLLKAPQIRDQLSSPSLIPIHL